MSLSRIGAVVGAVLALTWITLGFGNLVIVVVAMGLGAIVGRYFDGRLDLSRLIDTLRGGRST